MVDTVGSSRVGVGMVGDVSSLLFSFFLSDYRWILSCLPSLPRSLSLADVYACTNCITQTTTGMGATTATIGVAVDTVDDGTTTEAVETTDATVLHLMALLEATTTKTSLPALVLTVAEVAPLPQGPPPLPPPCPRPLLLPAHSPQATPQRRP